MSGTISSFRAWYGGSDDIVEVEEEALSRDGNKGPRKGWAEEEPGSP